LPNAFWASARKRGQDYTLTIAPRLFGVNQFIELKIVRLPQQEYFLAAFASRLPANFSEAASSGWLLSGPGELSDDRRHGRVLAAFYPRPENLRVSMVSLDRPGDQK